MNIKYTHLRFEFRLLLLIALIFSFSVVQGITDSSDGTISQCHNFYTFIYFDFCCFVYFCVYNILKVLEELILVMYCKTSINFCLIDKTYCRS